MLEQPGITQIAIIDGVTVTSDLTTSEIASAVQSIDAILTNDSDDSSVVALNAAAISATQHPDKLPKVRVLISDSGFVTIPRMNSVISWRFGGGGILHHLDKIAGEEMLSTEFDAIFTAD